MIQMRIKQSLAGGVPETIPHKRSIGKADICVVHTK